VVVPVCGGVKILPGLVVVVVVGSAAVVALELSNGFGSGALFALSSVILAPVYGSAMGGARTPSVLPTCKENTCLVQG
jgi:hypothetical protein